MHDIKWIRENPAEFDAALARRGLKPSSAELLAIDAARRADLTILQEGQANRNALARAIGQAKRAGEPTGQTEAEAAALRTQLEALEARLATAEAAQRARLASLPNRLDPTVPDGVDETQNQLQKQFGTLPEFPFAPRQHFELGEALGLMDFEAAGRIAGARFTVLHGALARLERALGQFMLDLHSAHYGFTETAVPSLVNDTTLFGTGQLPKFAEDCFRTTDGRWLIPTAEVPLTNLVAGQILSEARLPIRRAALTDCYRSEAGSAGRDTRGMLRQHQFRKVELVTIATPEQSDAEHEHMTRAAEAVLETLALPYRRMLLCAGDTGFAAAKTYDLEVWLPGQGAFREISSCSNCRDFQARRMEARYRPTGAKTTQPVHTLNGSGVAVGRALIAVMENHQQADGTILVPEVLRPYMSGIEVIRN